MTRNRTDREVGEPSDLKVIWFKEKRSSRKWKYDKFCRKLKTKFFCKYDVMHDHKMSNFSF